MAAKKTEDTTKKSKKKDRAAQSKGLSTKAAKAAKADKAAPTPEDIVAAAREAAFKDEHPEQAFNHFRPLAEAVPAEDLTVFTGEPLVMRANVKQALAIVGPHLGKAVARLQTPHLREVFELPSLVMGLGFAAGRVPVAKLSAGDIERMLTEGGPWRELGLKYLEIVSHPFLGLLPRERVAKIRAGKGPLDKAEDFVALAGVFAEFKDNLAGKHPFPADKVNLLATLGGALVQQMRHGRAGREAPKRTQESILRDQMASLVVDRYDDLQVIAAVALGKRKADELLPALRSTAGVAMAEEPEPGAADAPGPADAATSLLDAKKPG